MSFMKDFNYLKIQMKDIVCATNNFDVAKVIGSGGFGRVYKGELFSAEGQKTFAFKKLDRRLGQGNIEFWKEVMMLSRYKHENLISLMHFCTEGGEMILVYEYASRGSLDRYLSDANALTWIQRLRVCVGAARGLHFLHDPKGTQQRALNRDIKSANILLDENWTPKVSDFGLSKLGPANQAHTYLISHGVGTPGYCDPLYMELGFLSKESDVYSFGVVLFEILCGRLCYEYCNREHTKVLVPKWRRCYDEKRLDDIILPGLKEQMGPGSLESFSAIAYQSVRKTREERPTMAKIVEVLAILLKQQEIFENNNRERPSLRLRDQMDQSLDDDDRLMFKSSMVNNRFHDRDDSDYSQSPPVSDGEESDDLEEMTDWEWRQWKRPTQKTLWDYYISDECQEDQFKNVFGMSKATLNMIFDDLHSALTIKTNAHREIPVPQQVAVCLYRLTTGDPLQTISNVFGLHISTCRKLVLEVCEAIRTVLMPEFFQWQERLEQIKTEFGTISGIPDITRSIYTTHMWIIAPKSYPPIQFNKKHSKRNKKTSYSPTVQGVVDFRGRFTDVCIGYAGSTTEGMHKNKAWIQHSLNEKNDKAQKIANDAVMRLQRRWTCLQNITKTQRRADLSVLVVACCVLHNICEINNEAMDGDLLFDDEIVNRENVMGNSVNAVQVRDMYYL